MSRVFITTEECYREKGYREFIPPVTINAQDLVEVLNSCAEPGIVGTCLCQRQKVMAL